MSEPGSSPPALGERPAVRAGVGGWHRFRGGCWAEPEAAGVGGQDLVAASGGGCFLSPVGIGMDSCVIPLRHGGLSLVQTTDFFYPLVEDPYMMVGPAGGSPQN